MKMMTMMVGEINDNHDGDLDTIIIIKAAISDLRIL